MMILNLLKSKKKQKKIKSAIFQKMFCPSFIISRIRRIEYHSVDPDKVAHGNQQQIIKVVSLCSRNDDKT